MTVKKGVSERRFPHESVADALEGLCVMRSRCVLRMRLSWPLLVSLPLGLIRFARLVSSTRTGNWTMCRFRRFEILPVAWFDAGGAR